MREYLCGSCDRMVTRPWYTLPSINFSQERLQQPHNPERDIAGQENGWMEFSTFIVSFSKKFLSKQKSLTVLLPTEALSV